MVGVITNRDILAHPFSTIRCFGWGVFFRAVAPWNDGTFLSLLQGVGSFRAAARKVPSILERCIDLEHRSKQLYEALERVFSRDEAIGSFFASLALQEQYHADLLKVCQAAALRKGWKANIFNPWEDYLPRLEQQMDRVESSLPEIDTVDAALKLVLQLESSEINEVFDAACAATDAAFVKRLKPFRKAMAAHMAYIAERIPELSPRLFVECRGLRARFPKVWK
jgi:hypothetical protein